MKLKRVADFILSAAALVILGPLFLLVALWIKLDSPGPIFFRHIRVGRNGKTFRIHKFRTMYAEKAPIGLQITVGADPRVTKAGAFLRKYKIDELPQLIDVLRGVMSFVGPRPEVPKYMELYPENIRREVLSVWPGITDRASIEFRNENILLAKAEDPEKEYIDKILPIKQRYYLEYVRSRSFLGDISIIFQTIQLIFFRRR